MADFDGGSAGDNTRLSGFMDGRRCLNGSVTLMTVPRMCFVGQPASVTLFSLSISNTGLSIKCQAILKCVGYIGQEDQQLINLFYFSNCEKM